MKTKKKESFMEYNVNIVMQELQSLGNEQIK